MDSLPSLLSFIKRPCLAARVKDLRVDLVTELNYAPADRALLDELSAQYFPPAVDGDTTKEYPESFDWEFILGMACVVPCRNLERLFIEVSDSLYADVRIESHRLRQLTFPHLQQLSLRFPLFKSHTPMTDCLAAIVRQAPNLQKCHFDTVYTDDANTDVFRSDSVKELIFDLASLHGSFLYLDSGFEKAHHDRIRSLADLTLLEEVVVCGYALALPSADKYAAFFPQSIRTIAFVEPRAEDFDQLNKFAAVAHQLPNLEQSLLETAVRGVRPDSRN
ncbi:hypothetical protein VHEMI09049 [[Torrubiella] hemipterigena]|uniref:Uncharacterized protein n=1 Tax=[Torrubiella] hemipterigena TaxID=1531966 RepID=A0A0A1TPL0_9HYPO|nr:hypothetical protein VHEMI09049 [[Torrubiella] hemipterigena]